VNDETELSKITLPRSMAGLFQDGWASGRPSSQRVRNRETGRSRGFGFVEVNGIALQEAIEAMNGFELQGRRLTVGPARPRPERY
jgi:RNA recognition motif-containing protein